jgi:pyridoxal 5'-phosphate synthase pdxT subunit
MKIGVLAIQGDFAAHTRMLERMDVESVEVRRSEDLEEIDGLIMPGGESTTMLKFVSEEGLAEPIRNLAHRGKPIFGTCAGAILLAREVTGPAQPSLGLIDITVERNAYGRQVDSFVGEAETDIEGGPLESVFIRAPRIIRLGPRVETLARIGGEPVLVREGNILVATFHPELSNDQRVHRLFVDQVRLDYHPLLENTKDEALQMG